MRKIIILIGAILCTATLFAQESTLEEQLIEASSAGDLLAVQTLLSEPDIDVNAVYDGETALTQACSEGHLDVVKELVNHPKIKINMPEINFNNTPLIAATAFGHTDIVKELLEHSPKLNEQNAEGYTALMYAAERGYKPIVDELIVKGADVTIVQRTRYNSNTGHMNRINNAALLAYKNKHIEIYVALLRVEVCINIADVVTFQLNKSRYYNSVDEFGNTLLMLAAKEGNIEIVRLLLNLNKKQSIVGRWINPIVNINRKNDNGDTALMLASQYGQLEVVNELLEEKNIDLDIKNISDKTAYDLAATQEIKDVIYRHKNISKITSEAIEKQVLEGVENFQLNK